MTMAPRLWFLYVYCYTKSVNVGPLLRSARLGAGLTQAQLAASAGVPQPSVSRIETNGSATVELVSRLLGALGLRLVAAPLDRPTVAESALAIRGQVAAGAHGTPAFRLLSEVANNVLEADETVLPVLVAAPPPSTGDRRYDAYIAAVVEHRLGEAAPNWTKAGERSVSPEWVVGSTSGNKKLEELIRAATPPAFRRHGVFIHPSDLTSA